MAKNSFVVAFVITLVTVIFFIVVNYTNKNNLTSFTIEVTGDFTSSGAERNYEANLTFVNNFLVKGVENYFVGEGGGCLTNCDRKSSCKISNQKWVDSLDGSDCKIDQFISLTKDGIEKQIEKKELKPINECRHRDLCYEIIKYYR